MKNSYLTQLRDKNTPRTLFRQAADKLAHLLAQEAAASLPLTPHEVETAFSFAKGTCFAGSIVLIPILRSGMAMLPSFLHYFEQARVGILGIKRDEHTALPHFYYENLPQLRPDDHIFVLDPMLATGGTALMTLDILKKNGADLTQTVFVNMICSAEGRERLSKAYPEVLLVTAATDPKLNAASYIVPGMGDFGDRYFGTS